MKKSSWSRSVCPSRSTRTTAQSSMGKGRPSGWWWCVMSCMRRPRSSSNVHPSIASAAAFMNAAAEAMLGWTFEELRGRRMHDMTHHHHPDGRPFPIEDCAVVRVLRDGHTLRDHDDFFIRKACCFLPVSYTVAPLRSSGEIVGLVVVCRDASERREAEYAIRADEADARLLQALGAELTAQDDAASLYRKIVDGASQLMRSEFASMQMLHPERGTSGELQ